MIQTIPADYIGEETVEYTFFALLSDNAKTRITAVLNDLTAELPGILWPMPPEQLHSTLCTIIQPKPYPQDKDALYELHKEQYENLPAQLFAALPKFTVTFDLIECSSHAVIVKSSDASSFNFIRSQLVTNLPFPAETRMPPTIIHSSIARYRKAVDLENIQAVIARHEIFIEEEVTEFKLLRNEVRPLQKYEVIRTYALK